MFGFCLACGYVCMCMIHVSFCCFFQAEDGIRDAQESRGLGDVYKRQVRSVAFVVCGGEQIENQVDPGRSLGAAGRMRINVCLLYTSDAADDLLCVDLGGRRIIKKKKY